MKMEMEMLNSNNSRFKLGCVGKKGYNLNGAGGSRGFPFLHSGIFIVFAGMETVF
jgi:hypothetical protein